MSIIKKIISLSFLFLIIVVLLLPIYVTGIESEISKSSDIMRIPLFSVGLNSLSLNEFQDPICTDSIYYRHQDSVTQLLGTEDLHLGKENDDLVAFSLNMKDFFKGEFVLLFSVDSQTIGKVPPCNDLTRNGFGYNVYTQATRNMAVSSAFSSTMLFDRNGANTQFSCMENNNLVVNHGDAGGVDFNAQLTPHPHDILESFTFDINGLASATNPTISSLGSIYFVDTSNSDIKVITEEKKISIYTSTNDLGLNEFEDKIDGLVVIDENSNNIFDENDQILFSLTPDSKSIVTLSGSFKNGQGANIFSVILDNGYPIISNFASAENLGLGAKYDNINALTIISNDPEINDLISFAKEWGIKKQ